MNGACFASLVRFSLSQYLHAPGIQLISYSSGFKFFKDAGGPHSYAQSLIVDIGICKFP